LDNGGLRPGHPRAAAYEVAATTRPRAWPSIVTASAGQPPGRPAADVLWTPKTSLSIEKTPCRTESKNNFRDKTAARRDQYFTFFRCVGKKRETDPRAHSKR